MIKKEKKDYGTKVSVTNKFKDETEIGVKLEVEYVPSNGSGTKPKKIFPGKNKTFRFTSLEDYLKISILNPGKIKEKHYKVCAASDVKCYIFKICQGEIKPIIFDESGSYYENGEIVLELCPLQNEKEKDKDGAYYYKGGTLKVLHKTFPLLVKVKKSEGLKVPGNGTGPLTAMEDDVTIGSNPPGDW